MAVVTGTALATGVGVGAAAAAGGTALVASGISAAAGIAQTASNMGKANKMKKAQVAAEEKATQAMTAARDKLDVNFYAGLGVQKEPYELEREAALQANAQLMQAGQAGERGAGEVAGRALALNQQAQAQTRTAMGKEMAALDKQVATEDSRLRDAGVNMDLAEGEAAAAAAEQASIDRQQYQKAALSGAAGVVTGAANAMLPEYFKQPGGAGGAGGAGGILPGVDLSSQGMFNAGSTQNTNPFGLQSLSGSQSFMQPLSLGNPTIFPAGLGGMDQYKNPFGN
tara:strand:+ start:1063 stop:1911 length:849 start_codon:yes stop_codon:yes gene_type:complete